MNTLLMLTSLVTLIIFALGIFSLYKDTFFTDIAEMFVHKIGAYTSTLTAANITGIFLLTFITSISVGVLFVLLAYVLLVLAIIALVAHHTIKGTLQ